MATRRKLPNKTVKSYKGFKYRKTAYTAAIHDNAGTHYWPTKMTYKANLYQIIGVKGALESPRLFSESDVKVFINNILLSGYNGKKYMKSYRSDMEFNSKRTRRFND